MNVYIETLGCPKNFYDTQVLGANIKSAGHMVISNPEEADVIIVNTCGFINDAKKESIDKIFEMSNFDAKLIVSGCLSQRYSKELFEEMPEADIFMGVNDYDRIAEVLENLEERNIYCSETFEKVLERKERLLDNNCYTSTLKIAEGCNNRCAYCIIPKIRGGYRSKKMEDCLAEAEYLAENGCKELILIAQDTTYYGYDLYGEFKLAKLLKELCKIEKLKWIRIMYAYEDRITDELIDVMAEEEKICKYIDIPIQHSSDNVLSAMRRRSTKESINKTLSKLREKIPDIAIRTTLITGFPGETEEDFDELYDFVKTQKFDRLGCFAYSREEDTEGFDMENQVDDDLKEERADSIMRLQLDISLEKNREKISTVQKVLIDEIDEDGAYIGRTMYDAPEIDNSVIFTSEISHSIGDMVDVYINDAYDYDLTGEEVLNEFTK